MADFQQIATVDQVPPGGRLAVLIDETPALLLRLGDEFYAIEDLCTHDGQPLTDGPLLGCEIVCPRHGARFDIRTGEPKAMPATEAVRTFEIQVRDNVLLARPRD